ncbi:hypothetical protein [Vibrio owensii]|uniref:hypothetical protein n=1 Tax=Vibrio owensii TaxID=696485 RepID=UPI002852A705|nr:hypothetical protein [Vibrio owensii]
MLEKVKQILDKNDLSYKAVGNSLHLKLPRAGGKVTIKYDYSTNSYLYSCNEYLLSFSSLIFFALSFNTLYQPDKQMWSGYAAGCMFAVAVFNLLQIVLAHIQMLDLKSQFREVGVYLKSGS